MSAARLKHFGWGREGEGLTAEEEAFVMARAEACFGTALKESASAPRLEDIKLKAPRVTAPASLPFCTSEHYDLWRTPTANHTPNSPAALHAMRHQEQLLERHHLRVRAETLEAGGKIVERLERRPIYRVERLVQPSKMQISAVVEKRLDGSKPHRAS
jgi:hypothetical protein